MRASTPTMAPSSLNGGVAGAAGFAATGAGSGGAEATTGGGGRREAENNGRSRVAESFSSGSAHSGLPSASAWRAAGASKAPSPAQEANGAASGAASSTASASERRVKVPAPISMIR